MRTDFHDIVLCEGYTDRAFWRGVLVSSGHADLFAELGRKPDDPWGAPVKSPQWGLRSPDDIFVRIVPCGGRTRKIKETLRVVLGEAAVKPPRRIAICLDDDGDGADSATRGLDAFRNIVESSAPGAIQQGDGSWRRDGVEFWPAVWTCGASWDAKGVPDKQTVERIVCAAIARAHGHRGQEVACWLESGKGTVPLHKSHAMSYYAKWYARNGSDDFYEAIWQDGIVAHAMREALIDGGAAVVAAKLGRVG